jgi:hypothetical protein
VYRSGGSQSDNPPNVWDIELEFISSVKPLHGLQNVVTFEELRAEPSIIRPTIAPAFDIQRTQHVLQIMAAAGFVTTPDIGIKLITVAARMRVDGHLVLCGPTGTGTGDCVVVLWCCVAQRQHCM